MFQRWNRPDEGNCIVRAQRRATDELERRDGVIVQVSSTAPCASIEHFRKCWDVACTADRVAKVARPARLARGNPACVEGGADAARAAGICARSSEVASHVAQA
ncbi:MAG: hypothetical protein U0166_11805 [Acidobacteriota bacterium]